MVSEPCPYHQDIESRVIRNARDIVTMQECVSDIRDRLLGRPTWAVCVIVAVLSTTSVTLLALLLSR